MNIEANKLCTNCKTRAAKGGFKLCVACRAKNRQKARLHREKMKAKGICVRCGKNQATEGLTVCKSCNDWCANYRRKRAAKKAEIAITADIQKMQRELTVLVLLRDVAIERFNDYACRGRSCEYTVKSADKLLSTIFRKVKKQSDACMVARVAKQLDTEDLVNIQKQNSAIKNQFRYTVRLALGHIPQINE